MSKRISDRLADRLEHHIQSLLNEHAEGRGTPHPLYEVTYGSMKGYAHPVMVVTIVVDPEDPPPHAKAGQYEYSTRFLIEFNVLKADEIRDLARRAMVDIGYLPASALQAVDAEQAAAG